MLISISSSFCIMWYYCHKQSFLYLSSLFLSRCVVWQDNSTTNFGFPLQSLSDFRRLQFTISRRICEICLLLRTPSLKEVKLGTKKRNRETNFFLQDSMRLRRFQNFKKIHLSIFSELIALGVSLPLEICDRAHFPGNEEVRNFRSQEFCRCRITPQQKTITNF